MGHLHQVALHNRMDLLEDGHLFETPLDGLLGDGNLAGKVFARISAHIRLHELSLDEVLGRGHE